MNFLTLSEIHLFDERALQKVAHLFSSIAGEENKVDRKNFRIYIQGNLGVGKTTFVRAFLKKSGVSDRVKSPTYTLLEVYQSSNLVFYHFDFYRLSHPYEWLDTEFRDLFCAEGIVIVEWPERLQNNLPVADLRIHLTYSGQGRGMTLSACTVQGTKWLNAIVPSLKGLNLN